MSDRASRDSDVELARSARAGSAAALEALYERYAIGLHRLAYRVTGSDADAADVIQDVFVALPETLAGYGGTGSLEGWLRRVTTYAALTARRRGQRRVEAPLDTAEPAPASDDGGRVVDTIVVRRAIESLPESLRTVFVLREVEGYTHAEIAGLLGIRRGTSEVRLYRAKALLQRFLGEP